MSTTYLVNFPAIPAHSDDINIYNNSLNVMFCSRGIIRRVQRMIIKIYASTLQTLCKKVKVTVKVCEICGKIFLDVETMRS